MAHVTIAERRSRLGSRHRLLAEARTDDVTEIVRSLVALHASDPASVYLSAAARMAAPRFGAVDDALLDARSIVRHHAMRRTLWVFEPATARAAHAACTAALAPKEWRRTAQLIEQGGVAADGDAWCNWAREVGLASIGRIAPCTARELGLAEPSLAAKLQLADGKPYAATQGAHTRLMLNLGFDGAIVRTGSTGSWIGGEYQWQIAENWIEGGLVDSSLTRSAAAATIAAEYLAAFGPATTADLQWWTGWTLTITRRALVDAGAVAVTMDDTDGRVDGWLCAHDPALDSARRDHPDAESWVAFLPSLDPTIMGWKQRGWYLGELAKFGGPLFDRNGNAGHSIWANGEVVGAWAQRPDGEIATRTLRPVDRATAQAIDRAADRVRAELGAHRFKARFPAPIQSELLAGA